MSSEAASAIISLIGVIASITVTVFLTGMRWGKVESKIEFMSDRLAKIEGMFTLRLNQDKEKS